TLTSLADARPGAWANVRIYGNGEAQLDSAIFEHGGAPDDGVVEVEPGGTASIRGCTFRDNVYGVDLGERTRVPAFEGNTFDKNMKAAIYLRPSLLGALGAQNRYGGGERIQVDGGRVEDSATWYAQGAPIEVQGAIDIDGRTAVTVEAGAR